MRKRERERERERERMRERKYVDTHVALNRERKSVTATSIKYSMFTIHYTGSTPLAIYSRALGHVERGQWVTKLVVEYLLVRFRGTSTPIWA